MDLDGAEPIYKQIAAEIKRRIDAGDYAPNRPIPSESALCDEFGVSRKTARAAVQLLNEAGITVPIHGRGVYVQPTE